MQTLIVTAAVHNASREFVYDQHLVILHHIVDIAGHDAVRLDSLIDVMQNGGRLRAVVHEIFNAEGLFGARHTLWRQRRSLGFFIHNVIRVAVFVVVFFLLVHFRDLDESELLGEIVDGVIEGGGFVALSRNNQRGSRFVDKDGVHLVHDGKVMTALHLLFLIDNHIVAQIVKTQLVVGAVGDIAGIRLAALVIFHIVQNQTDTQAEEAVNLAHPLAVALGEVVVDGDDMNALAAERVQVRRQGRHERFTFTGLHFGNTSLMEDNAADDLHGEVLHAQHAPARLAADGICVGKDVVKVFALGQSVFENLRLAAKLAVRHRRVLFLQRKHLVTDGLHPLDLTVGIAAEYFL